MAIVLQKDIAPEKKGSITKDAMFKYIESYGTLEDAIWFGELEKKYRTKKENHLRPGETVDGYDIKNMRKEFIDKFYPNAYKKEKKSKKAELSFEDKIKKLIEDKKA